MGRIDKLVCNNCGKRWTHFNGVHSKCVYYYCDKCGAMKICKFNNNDELCVDLSSEFGTCECGGVFTSDSDCVICPSCKSTPTMDVRCINSITEGEELALEMAQQHSYDGIEFCFYWENYEIYKPLHNDDSTSRVGYPQFIMSNKSEAKFCENLQELEELMKSLTSKSSM